MISLYSLFGLLIIHFVFDFILQDDEMAKGKSKSNIHLTDHVSVYSMGLFIFAWWHAGQWTALVGISWWALNTILHWITDYYTSRINAKLWKENRTHDFFVGVGADQLIHYVTLIGTFVFFSNL